MLVWDKRMKVLIHRKHEKFRYTRQTCQPGTFRYVEENIRHERFGKEVRSTLGCPGCATIGSHHQASHSDTCRDRMRAELEKSEEGREYLAREQARVDARKQEQSSSSGHKRAVPEEWDRPPEKFWRMGEEDVTVKQDITATSGASSSSASRGLAMGTESRPSSADVQTEDLEVNEQLDADESAASLHKRRRSLLVKDCSSASGNTSSLKRTTSVWKTELPEMDTWASTKVWTSRQ